MLAFLLAAQIVASDPNDQVGWFTVDDVPSFLTNLGTGAWQVPYRVDVSPEGKILDCQTEVKSPVAQLDIYTCRIIRRRARFKPARIDGRPTHGIFRSAITFGVAVETNFAPPITPNADIQVVVNRLPARTTSPSYVRVAFIVDEGGEKSSCTGDTTANRKSAANDPALVPVACEQIMKSYKATPARVAGVPTISFQNATVGFVAAKPIRDLK